MGYMEKGKEKPRGLVNLIGAVMLSLAVPSIVAGLSGCRLEELYRARSDEGIETVIAAGRGKTYVVYVTGPEGKRISAEVTDNGIAYLNVTDSRGRVLESYGDGGSNGSEIPFRYGGAILGAFSDWRASGIGER
jgi:hypothetical protein